MLLWFMDKLTSFILIWIVIIFAYYLLNIALHGELVRSLQCTKSNLDYADLIANICAAGIRVHIDGTKVRVIVPTKTLWQFHTNGTVREIMKERVNGSQFSQGLALTYGKGIVFSRPWIKTNKIVIEGSSAGSKRR
ncbi:hypothetical protein PT287_08510 [Lactobacillus sp. ESL0679]|uniref:hypothetical protein n=1 Tax=Lactobacillus sp. ESL0679 TaxID=2983209 RepID=UPI0023F75432|nr:hypothetical protein [Lactobacillus sp. ESL0679]MDF7683537.1 hypothetical protein [Lactobacillus sp. ESL0679]